MKSKKGGDTGCLKILAKKGCISYMDCCTSFTNFIDLSRYHKGMYLDELEGEIRGVSLCVLCRA